MYSRMPQKLSHNIEDQNYKWNETLTTWVWRGDWLRDRLTK